MLLAEAIELLRTGIESINWVEKYGGLVHSSTYVDKDFDSGARITKTMPISCSGNVQECNDPSAFYTEFVPDDRKTSILYFETIQGLTVSSYINNNDNLPIFTGRVRLVGWVNTRRLAKKDCFLSGKLIRSLLPFINKEFKPTTGVFEGGTVHFKIVKEVEKNENIFSNYTYDLDQQFLMYPYDYFAIEIEVKAFIKSGCSYTVEIPNSAYWDGTAIGGSVAANFLGDGSGTFTGVQRYGFQDCEYAGIEGDVITFVVKGVDRSDTTIVLGTFTGSLGDILNDSSKWVTDYDIYDYIAGNPVAEGALFSFAKLDFANDNGFINLSSLEIFLEIRRGQTTSGAIDAQSNLYIFREDVEGAYVNPIDISIAENSSKVYVAESSSNTGISQSFLDRLYTSRKIANDYSLANITRVIIDDTINPLGDIYYVQGTSIYYQQGVGTDADGFTIFGAPQLVELNYFTTGRILALLPEIVNGRKTVFTSGLGGVGSNIDLIQWDGANWVVTSLSGGVFNVAPQLTSGAGSAKVIGQNVYCNYNATSSLFKGLTRLSYVNDPLVLGNWARFDYFKNVSAIPSLGGIQGAQGIAVSETLTYNGFARTFVCNPANNVIQEVRATVPNPASDADFEAVILSGAEGVSGNVDGELLDARFTNPFGCFLVGNILYVVEYIGAYVIRAINLTTNQVTTIKGQFGVSSKTEYIEF